MEAGIWIALIALVPVAAGGIWRAYRDGLRTARDEALATARLEAVAREAQAALVAKNAELDAEKARSARIEAALIECAREGRR